MKNIIRRRGNYVVDAVTFAGVITITEDNTTAVSCSFDIDENFPYTWTNGYECVRTDIDMPDAYTGGGEWKLLGDSGSYTWEQV